MTRQRNLSVRRSRRTTPLPPPPRTRPAWFPARPARAGARGQSPAAPQLCATTTFPNPALTSRAQPLRRGAGSLSIPPNPTPTPKKKQKQPGPTGAAPDDVGESVSGGGFPGLPRAPRLSHSQTHVPRLPHAPNFGGRWVRAVRLMLS